MEKVPLDQKLYPKVIDDQENKRGNENRRVFYRCKTSSSLFFCLFKTRKSKKMGRKKRCRISQFGKNCQEAGRGTRGKKRKLPRLIKRRIDSEHVSPITLPRLISANYCAPLFKGGRRNKESAAKIHLNLPP